MDCSDNMDVMSFYESSCHQLQLPSSQFFETSSPVYPGFMFLSDEINEIRRYFDQADQKRYKWVGPLESRNGSLCVHVRAVEFVGGIEVWKDFVIKTPLGNGKECFEEETQRLQELRGSHLVQEVDLPFNPLDQPLPNPQSPDKFYEWNGQIYASGSGSYAIPYLVLEYLENGTLGDLIRKARKRRLRLPNLLLWGLFRCLINASAEMVGVNQGPERQGRNFIHPRFTLDNVLVGKYYPKTVDHRISPILKVTNFGRPSLDEPLPFGINGTMALGENLKAVGMIMQCLIALTDNEDDHYKETRWFRSRSTANEGFETFATLLSPVGREASDVTKGELPFPWLDPVLRYIVCRLAAADPAQRQSVGLPTLLHYTAWALSRATNRDLDSVHKLLSRLLQTPAE
ncbi:hypothetical protein F5Y05DRAFT_380693 [Hypoxylon sp. FL0543]|nr:hypothetical protein F5Y05DRAFT_380693 [Hypoxylon sp. FL0543]